ncbi:hypothetical protein F1847_08905 [Thermodesulfobacterium sp. TA1]|uniref:hypothetical protein n=1 Tax=Thermodesulfobacterium sp. TA1 TaxID=2234087 RepID=UPI001232B64A|nr:hypothetical protein [Thermodesulfobacterium sp. TA1]QER42854.1 hypothetical protein F1847_08905 [Thermodesulfobacterium sp. TA1]
MRVAIHVTHEALYKIGGIGEVINNLCTSPSYLSYFDKTLLYGPLFEYLGSPSTRLGKDGIVFYSSKDHYDTGHFGVLFKPILEKYNIDVVYGKRRIVNELNPERKATVEILLVDITHVKKDILNFYKYLFWENFGLSSDQYEKDWDYEQYFRIALPFLDLVQLIFSSAKEMVFFGHEYMGVPTLLSLELHPDYQPERHKRIFYAHEVAPVRRIVENLGGGDIGFYNILKKAKEANLSLEEVFGPQDDWYRTPLVKLAKRVDQIFAVGDWVVEEYRFLCPDVEEEKIRLVYNGVSSDHVDFDRKEISREKLGRWLSCYYGFVPDLYLTHICRLVKSKGIWRDFIFLAYLDDLLSKHNLKGIYILLSSLVGQGRPPHEVEKMVKSYPWPFEHREGWPDLIGYEIEVYRWVERFNQKAKNIKALFINQVGFSNYKCPFVLKEDLETIDLRIASDLELGMSIYEPFGIAHIEVLPFGGISVPSTSCGVYFFLEKSFAKEGQPFYGVDFISIGEKFSVERLKDLTEEQRRGLEEFVLASKVEEIFAKIPKNRIEREKHSKEAERYKSKLSWDRVVKEFLLENLKSL